MSHRLVRSDFLDALFGEHCTNLGEFILLRNSPLKSGARGSSQYFPGPERLSSVQFSKDRHIFYGVCPRSKMNAAKEHIRFIPALWASLDIGPGGYSGKNANFVNPDQARIRISQFPIKPSAIVRSGAGFHLYWFFDRVREISDVEVFEGILRKLNAFFRCESELGLDSILRLPDTWNNIELGSARKCLLERLDHDRRYKPEDFINLDYQIEGVSDAEAEKAQAPQSGSEEPSVGKNDAHPSRKDDSSGFGALSGRVLSEKSRKDEVAFVEQAQPQSKRSSDSIEIETVRGIPRVVMSSLADTIADELGDRLWSRFMGRVSDVVTEQAVQSLRHKLKAPVRDD